jgi:osmotically-inducible protein OsmY
MKASILRPLAAVAVAASALAALSACVPLLVGGVVAGGTLVATDRRTSGAIVDDEGIELRSASRLREALGDRANLSLTSFNRVVLLTGDVPDAADKATAEQIVARVDNVQSVVSELVVGPQRAFPSRSRDALLTTKVKASLIDAKDLFSNSIKVVTAYSNVYLMGRVTEREANRATEVARGVDGVAKVVRVFQVITEAELANTATTTKP